jgi:acetamidase/formamidase
VWVDGGMFSVGDIHAAQGDGEVCVTAIECPGQVTLRFNILKNAQLEAPQYFLFPDWPFTKNLEARVGKVNYC